MRYIVGRKTSIDLFCGCGGLTLGLRRAGFCVVAAVEINALAAETYRKNHKSVSVWENDIRNIDPLDVIKNAGLQIGDLDLLAGCPPCQGFSNLRTKNGAYSNSDPRNDLLFEFERFVRVLHPHSIMLENVPQLSNDSRFSTFIDNLSVMGYHCDYRIVDAADYGVPQRRKRLIFFAGLGFSIPFVPICLIRKTVKQAIGALPVAGQSGDWLHDKLSEHSPKIQELIRHIPKDGGSRTQLPKELWLPCHKKVQCGFNDVYGRMKWDDVAPTITSGCFNPSKGRFLHPQENRAITLREASILQGFPPKYKFPLNNRNAVGMMIGNALPPPLITAHAKNIMNTLNKLAIRTNVKH